MSAAKYKRNKIIEVIIVDDASKDESVSFLKANYPEIKLFKHRINRGFSSSVNLGVRMAKGDLVALLNSDVKPSKNFAVHTLKHFADSKVFAVSLSEQEHSWAKGYFKDGFIQFDEGKNKAKTHISLWASGGSGIFVRKIWKKIGGLDEELFSPFYWEDSDLGYRAWKRGYKVLWEPKAKVLHNHAQTISKKKKSFRDRIIQRNQLFFNWKNLTSSSLLSKHIFAVFKKVIRHPHYLLVLISALTKVSVVLKRRKKEFKEAIVSDEAIFEMFKNE